jgi:hypothetical protein
MVTAQLIGRGRTKQEVARTLVVWRDVAPHFGRLDAAVGRGEAPSLYDVETVQDVDDVVACCDEADLAPALDTALHSALGGDALSDAVARRILEVSPTSAWTFLAQAGAQSDEARARSMLDRVLRLAPPTLASCLNDRAAWVSMVRNGHAARAAELLREHEWHERVAPIYEALKAAGEGRRGELVYLAPELRKPTEAILASWFADEEETPAAYAAPRGKAARAAEGRPTWGKRVKTPATSAKGGRAKKPRVR